MIAGVDAVVHLITEDIYIDIRFLSWTTGNGQGGTGGGGFSYMRSTPAPVATLREDIVVDFGIIGLWARMNGSTWFKLNNLSPLP